MYCKHPEDLCSNMTFYNGRTYCDNQENFCHLYDESPIYTNSDCIRDMEDEDLAELLFIIDSRDGYSDLDSWKKWLKQPAENKKDD